MAKCQTCEKEMTDGVSCTVSKLEFPLGAPMSPVLQGDNSCEDCKCPPGGVHHPGCDREECPRCGGQLRSCGCMEGTGPVDSKVRALAAWRMLKVFRKQDNSYKKTTISTSVPKVEGEEEIYDAIADFLHLACASGLSIPNIIRLCLYHFICESPPSYEDIDELQEIYDYLNVTYHERRPAPLTEGESP